MSHLRLYVLSFIVTLSIVSALAADFFDTGKPGRFITLGARIGLNTSNMTTGGKDIFDIWDKNSWGTGFDIGFIADLHIRNYISIQPGIFFQSRSGNFTYASTYWLPVTDENGNITEKKQELLMQYGHNRNYNLVIPIIASGHFNIGDKVKWNVDFGPYISFRIGNDGRPNIYELRYGNDGPVLHSCEARSNAVDFGFKMGTGFTFLDHYYFGVHYMAGATDVWKNTGMGGRNKAWTFTAGYDF